MRALTLDQKIKKARHVSWKKNHHHCSQKCCLKCGICLFARNKSLTKRHWTHFKCQQWAICRLLLFNWKGNIFESFEKQILAIEMSLGLWNETRPSEINAETCSQTFSSDLLQESDLIGWIWELIVLPWKIPNLCTKNDLEIMRNFDISRRKWGHFLSPIPPPQILWIYLQRQFCLSFLSARRARRGRGGGWNCFHVTYR